MPCQQKYALSECLASERSSTQRAPAAWLEIKEDGRPIGVSLPEDKEATMSLPKGWRWEPLYRAARSATPAHILGLLKVSKCPACDGSGSIPHQVREGEWEAEQCQWCDERSQINFGPTDGRKAS